MKAAKFFKALKRKISDHFEPSEEDLYRPLLLFSTLHSVAGLTEEEVEKLLEYVETAEFTGRD